MNLIKFIDLFAGIGGIRKGFEAACYDNGYIPRCVFTSEIKPHAVEILKQNYPDTEIIHGDITKIPASYIPDFDILLGGFPCQAFSYAGKRLGFSDTRGTLFFEIERILKEKKPKGFILENVEGLVTHDRENAKEKIGRTLKTIIARLEGLGYKTTWEVLNAKDFGVPQDRKRIYITGAKNTSPNLKNHAVSHKPLSAILQKGLQTSNSDFIRRLLSYYKAEELCGKSIKDKRGGNENIHSWDIELKGPVSEKQKRLLNIMLTERRKKRWAGDYGIEWMDGMPLMLDQIRTFCDYDDLEEVLEDLTAKGYLKKEHPKRKTNTGREQDKTLPLGYNIVTGKMSFEVNKILDPNGYAPALVAMDMKGLYVADTAGLRPLSLREGLRLFGYPDDFKFDIDIESGYDLLGNTVAVSVITFAAERLLDAIYKTEEIYCGEDINETELIRRAV